MQLPAAERALVEQWDAELRTVTEPITKALADVARRMGVGYSTALRKWYAWQESGLAGLFNRAKGSRKKELSPEFIEWWKQLCQENGRKCKPAYRKFVALFRSGAAIPGIPADVLRYNVPRGYSYDNLMAHAPTRHELMAARQGLRAADAYRPLVFTTRKNMQVGQELVFDDVWHDFEVVVLGQREPSRLLQLCVMDVFSGCLFDLATKPRIRRESNGTRENISPTEALFYVAHVLEDHGYHADGARLILEAGTMTLSEDVARALHDLTGGKLICHVGKTSNAVAFGGQYGGVAKGNYRLKAMLESFFNLLHNETADVRQLPGQTGSNSRINEPEDLHGRKLDVTRWLQALPALPEELRRQVRLGLVEYNAADRLVRQITDRINLRREHQIEGYAEAGLTTVDYELPGLGVVDAGYFLQRLDAQEDDAKRAALQSYAVPRPRLMSPQEVYNAGQSRLTKLRPEIIARMLYHARRSEPVKVGHTREIVIEDKLISASPLRFTALRFRPGDKFDVVLNPWHPDKLHVFDAAGRWVGVLDVTERADRTDVAAVEAQMREAARVQQLMREPIRKRGMEITMERLVATRENIDLLSTGVELTAAEKQHARELKKFGGDLSELAAPNAPAPAPVGPDDFSAEGLL